MRKKNGKFEINFRAQEMMIIKFENDIPNWKGKLFLKDIYNFDYDSDEDMNKNNFWIKVIKSFAYSMGLRRTTEYNELS